MMNETMQGSEALYTHAFAQYQTGGIEKAIEAFRVLCAEQPLEARFWFGLAASLQEGRDYKLALHAWAMAALLDPKDPYPHFHAAECSLSIDDRKDAILALQEAQKRIDDAKHPLQDRILVLKEAWSL